MLFIVSTTGFTISKHYCGGNLVSVALNTNPASCCDMSSCSCCHDESEFLQLKNDFTVSQHSNTNPSPGFEFISINLESDKIIEPTKEFEFTIVANGSPFKDRQFLYYIHQFKLAPPIC